MANTVGFLSGVNGGTNVAETASQRFFLGASNSRDVLSHMEAHQKKGVAESALARLGDLTDTAKIAAFFGDQIVAGKGSDAGGGSKTLGLAQVSSWRAFRINRSASISTFHRIMGLVVTAFCQVVPLTYTCQRGRYWIASARCAVSMRSEPARSAMVRASLRVR